jgi:hypothetical protein
MVLTKAPVDLVRTSGYANTLAEPRQIAWTRVTSLDHGSARASIQCSVETHDISTSVDIVDHSGASPYRRMSGSSSLPM